MNKHKLFSVFVFAFCLLFYGETNIAFANELKSTEYILAQNENNVDSSVDNEDNTNTENNTDTNKVEITIDDLRVPDAPALSIIGTSKTEISRPGTPRAFGLSLIEAFSDSEAGIPQNLAIDLAPYWWSERTFNTLDDYICRSDENPEVLAAPDCEPIVFGESLLRSLTLSIASSQEDVELDGEDVDLTRLGLGLRFSIIPGEINPAFLNKYSSISPDNFCIYKINENGEKIKLSLEEWEQCKTDEGRIKFLTNLAKELEELSATRIGWQLDLALASALDFEDDSFDDAEFSRFGTWLTASYRLTLDNEVSAVTFLGVARYLYDDFDDAGDNLVDLGGRVIWNPVSNPLSLSLEYLRRFGDDGDDRIVGIAQYKFDETYSIFASFGKTFEEDFTGNDDLVTFLGLNIGLGKKPTTEVTVDSFPQ